MKTGFSIHPCILFIFAFFLPPVASHAARVYVFFDKACMERLEYSYKGGEYIVYHINVGQGEKLILEVGKENKDLQNTLPLSYQSCSNGRFDQSFASRVNSNTDDVYVIFEITNKQYLISPVTLAAYYKRTNQAIAYTSPKYSFQFDLQYGTIGENISTNTKAQVFFEGRLENACSGAYIFKQTNQGGTINTQADLIFLPEIGIVDEKIGFNAADAQQNALMLKTIQGKTPEQYLLELCQGVSASNAPQSFEISEINTPKDYDVTPKSPYGTTAGTSTNPPAANSMTVTATTHKVQKGETLYSISKKYNVSVSQLRDWNNMGSSNIIHTGNNLYVSAPGTATSSSTSSTGTYSPNISFPAPYENTGTLTTKTGEVKYHSVKSGETVASIARLYGYTESKFREINGLGKTEFIKIGQRLKVTDCECPDNGSVYYPVNTPANTPSGYDYTTGNLTPKSPETTTSLPNTIRTNTGSTTGSPWEAPVLGLKSAATDNNTPTSYGYQDVMSNKTGSQDFQPKSISPFGDYTSTSNTGLYPSSYDAATSTIQNPQSFSETTANGVRRVHVVQEGETLYRIARTYGVTVERLRELNNLELNEVIMPYQRLYID